MTVKLKVVTWKVPEIGPQAELKKRLTLVNYACLQKINNVYQ